MKKITLLLISVFLLGFIGCKKDDSPKTMDEQIAECDFENTSASLTVNQKSVENVGAFKVTDQIEKDKTIQIFLVGCDEDEQHIVQIVSFGDENSVIENGVYNLEDDFFGIQLQYSVGAVASDTQVGLSLIIGESGTITVTDNSVKFDVIGENPFTGTTVSIVGEGNF